MSTIQFPLYSAVQVGTGDTAATNLTLVRRDVGGQIYGTLVQGTSLQTTGALIVAYAPKTASFTADNTATTFYCDATTGTINIALPSASASAGQVYYVVKTDSSSNHVILTGALGNGNLATQNAGCRVQSDGTNWRAV